MPPEFRPSEFWQGLLGSIRHKISAQQFETWFRGVRPGQFSDGVLELTVANAFSREWLRRKYGDMILREAEKANGGRRPTLKIRVRDHLESPADAGSAAEGRRTRSVSLGGEENARVAAEPARDRSAPTQRPATHLNPAYRFEGFVAGPGNQLPLAAARAVVASESRGYNPLFVHGGVGLGKTHLLQAMAQAFGQDGSVRRVLYVPCEHFVNHFITSVERQALDAFRRTYREADVLIMDDVHLLAGKERSQEEFLHTFNLLYNSNRQVVLSADAEPGAIPFLTERLTSRFRWGLVCELGSPDLATRMELVRARARRLETPLPDEVVRFLAEHVRSNVRELEGAVVRVAGHAALTEVAPSLALAQEVLKDVVRSNRKRVSLDHITGVVTERFGVKLADLQGKRRIQAIVLPRQVCMYLARRLTGLSLEAVGGYFGGRDHSTVLYGVDRMSDRMQRDESFRSLVEELTREVVKRVEP